ncbi:MAG: xanthine dehydrogenase family protein molybdopterin-binding subunit [Treponema sp.]|nr:xanthine dehydrogenase family protein molybdopterin-binding subunit [Treponema sp.]
MPEKSTAVKHRKRSLEATGFYSDANRDGMLYAVLVRSPAAAGKLKNVTIPQLPEGYFLFTASDVPGSKKININGEQWKIFGYDNIMYRGEPLGILCGPDENKVLELLEEVSVNFDIESLETALQKAMKHQKGPVVKFSKKEAELSSFVNELNDLPSLDTVLDNRRIEQNKEEVLAFREIKTGVFLGKGAAQADKKLFGNKKFITTQETWEMKLIPPLWKETCGSFCWKEGKNLHISAPTRWTMHLMQTVADELSIPIDDIIVHKTKTSGVFSKGLWRTSVLAAQVALASFKTSKPVKLILTQQEQDSYMAPGVKTKVEYKTAVSEKGEINGIYANIDVDVGCFNPFAKEIADRLSIVACNYYKPHNVHIITTIHTSKNPPTSICIKGIDSQIFFAIENHIQKITAQANMLPEEIRMQNLNVKKNDYPFLFESQNALQTLNKAVSISDFNRKYTSFSMDALDRVQENSNPFFALPLRGIGIATAFNVSDYYGSTSFPYEDKIEVTLQTNDHVIIHTINPSQGVQDIWKKTVSEILEIKPEYVTIDSEFDISELPGQPEDTYNTISSLNELIKKACADIQKKRFHQPLPITVKKSTAANIKKNWDIEKFCGNPFGTTSYATAVVEVELDTYTYNERIKGIWIVIDCGELFDKTAALKAIRLEIQQELEMLVEEKSIPCENITIDFIQSKDKSGQIGELVRNTLPAAFSSALSLALATQLTKLPCTEKQLFELIKKRETRIEKQNQEETAQEVNDNTEAKAQTQEEDK